MPRSGVKDAADLRRLDVDVDTKVRPLQYTSGEPVWRFAQRLPMPSTKSLASIVGVAVAVAGLQAAHADHQRVVVGDRAPAHQRRNHGRADELGELLTSSSLASALMMPPPATIKGRSAAIAASASAFSICLRLARRLVGAERLVGVDVELDLSHLHVERQVDQHRPRPARAHQVEGLLERARHLRRLAHRDRPLGHRLGNRFDVDRLEVFLVEPGSAVLGL